MNRIENEVTDLTQRVANKCYVTYWYETDIDFFRCYGKKKLYLFVAFNSVDNSTL